MPIFILNCIVKKVFPAVIKMNIITFLLFIAFTYVNGQDRRIVSKLNPGCQQCTDFQTLVYIKADSSRDTIHQIWDFTRGAPSVIYAVASLNSSLRVTWEKTEPVKFELSETPEYSFAAAIDKVYEYEDLDDDGHIDPKYPQRGLSLRHLSWRRNDSVLTDKEAKVVMQGTFRDGWRKGIINMKLDLLPFKDYATDLPHLIHTANSTLVDVSLVNLTTSREFNASRFALRVLLVSNDSPLDSWDYTMRKSLDDEHTPGVFEIIEIKSPRSSHSDDGGFLQFRPVAYTEPERGVSSSTNAHISVFNPSSLPQDSTLKIFYLNYDSLLVQNMFVSFGLAGDGYYKQHNFTGWSFTIGYGKPPLESVSLFVIIIISIGLGVPVLLALSGITYVLTRRCKQRNPPTRLTNEE